MKKVLFLCSGNYYRSRFAEIVFNTLATRSELSWRADSRGLKPDSNNEGPISQHALRGLAERGIELAEPIRFPMRAEDQDFLAADRVIAVKEAEHRTMMQRWFPNWMPHTEFWTIDDIDCAEPGVALPELFAAVTALHESLREVG